MRKKLAILFDIQLGRLCIAVFSFWLGFNYKDFGKGLPKRQDFGFIKFWLD